MYLKFRQRLVIPFLLPTLIVYTIFVFVPIILTISYGFTNWQGQSMDRPFYGLKNYLLISMDPQVIGAAKNTVIFVIVGAVITFIPSMFISWALTQKIKLKKIFRYIIIAPVVLSVVVTSLLWRLLYNPIFGPINNFLKLIGLKALALPWLGDPRTVLVAIIIASAWQELGMWVLLITAGMERIPSELLDAARIDGANEWQVYWQVTMPMLWGILRLLFIMWIILSLQVFAQVAVMVPYGAGGGAAEVIAHLIYLRAFTSRQWGLASAMGTLLFIVVLSASLIMNRLTKRETVEF